MRFDEAAQATESALVYCLVCLLFTIGAHESCPRVPMEKKAAKAWIRDGGFVELMESSLGEKYRGPESGRERAHAALLAVVGKRVPYTTFGNEFCPVIVCFLAETPDQRTPLRLQFDSALEEVRRGVDVSTAITEFVEGVEKQDLKGLDPFRQAFEAKVSFIFTFRSLRSSRSRPAVESRAQTRRPARLGARTSTSGPGAEAQDCSEQTCNSDRTGSRFRHRGSRSEPG